jgi:hypothetical protein
LNLESNDVCRFDLISHGQMMPGVLRQIEQLGAFIQEHRQQRVGGVLSAADYLKTMRIMLYSSDNAVSSSAGRSEDVRSLWDNTGSCAGSTAAPGRWTPITRARS